MLTAKEIEARRHHIGASDVAAMMGISTFRGRNARSLYLGKTDQLEPEKNPSAAITAGNLLEPVILDYAEGLFGKLNRNVIAPDPCGGPLSATLDGQVVTTGRPVEAKTSGIEGPLHGHWGDRGTNAVPRGYFLQAMTQILCTGMDRCDLIALLGGRGFCEFVIWRDEELISTIKEIAEDFWTRYVVPKRDPATEWHDRLKTVHGLVLDGDPCSPILETEKRRKKMPGKAIKFTRPDLVIDWQQLRQACLDAQKMENAAQAAVLMHMDDAESAEVEGAGMLTNFNQNGAGVIDRKMMKVDGVFDKYNIPSSHRVLRWKRSGKSKG